MCVELDLTKPLVPEFNVEGQVLSVVYESLGLLCNKCGQVDHVKEGCVAESNKGNSMSVANGSHQVWGTYEVVPETNLDRYEGKKVDMNDKENLHPGEHIRSEKIMMNRDQIEEKEDPIESLVWNCRGAASKGVAAVLRDMKVDITTKAQALGFVEKASRDINVPWLLAGDFNDMKTPLEHKGGGRVNETRCRNFNSWIQDCNLINFGANGPFYTWRGPKWEGLESVYKRADSAS
ncbi:hypothetical protein K1719_005923 [Acacia pycnantha]|nr:hypothetical protein K1719_005923 [Acacia pycnantha]